MALLDICTLRNNCSIYLACVQQRVSMVRSKTINFNRTEDFSCVTSQNSANVNDSFRSRPKRLVTVQPNKVVTVSPQEHPTASKNSAYKETKTSIPLPQEAQTVSHWPAVVDKGLITAAVQYIPNRWLVQNVSVSPYRDSM